jgi:hypothetical protein
VINSLADFEKFLKPLIYKEEVKNKVLTLSNVALYCKEKYLAII